MTYTRGRLVWGASPKSRIHGLSRGVIGSSELGVSSWPGLVSVSIENAGVNSDDSNYEGRSMFSPQPGALSTLTISSYGVPIEFEGILGNKMGKSGAYFSSQPRVPFSLSHRVEVGDGYKIYLFYTLIAETIKSKNVTISGSQSADIFSFKTHVVSVPGLRPVQCVIINSNFTDPGKMTEFEDILYGSPSNAPSFPSVQDISELFGGV